MTVFCVDFVTTSHAQDTLNLKEVVIKSPLSYLRKFSPLSINSWSTNGHFCPIEQSSTLPSVWLTNTSNAAQDYRITYEALALVFLWRERNSNFIGWHSPNYSRWSGKSITYHCLDKVRSFVVLQVLDTEMLLVAYFHFLRSTITPISSSAYSTAAWFAEFRRYDQS